MTANCLCGSVSVIIDAKPEFIHDCNCTLCQKSGGAWGYFSPATVHVVGETTSVMRKDKDNPAAEVQSCKSCSATTHFTMAKSFTDQHGPIDMMGVNMRLFDTDSLHGVEVRFPDGKNWTGAGPFEYRRNSMTIGNPEAW